MSSPSKVPKIEEKAVNVSNEQVSPKEHQNVCVTVTPTKNGEKEFRRRVNPRTRRKLVDCQDKLVSAAGVLKETTTNVQDKPASAILKEVTTNVLVKESTPVAIANSNISKTSRKDDYMGFRVEDSPFDCKASTMVTPQTNDSFDYSFGSKSPETEIKPTKPSYMKILDFKTPVVEKKKSRKKNIKNKPPLEVS